MLSFTPIDLKKVKKEDIDKEICRLGMIAELDAVSLYEQLAAETENKAIKKILLDIAKEEKTHKAEFETLLLRIDKEQERENQAGRKEVEEKT
jgi:rubrerythrin